MARKINVFDAVQSLESTQQKRELNPVSCHLISTRCCGMLLHTCAQEINNYNTVEMFLCFMKGKM